MEMENLTEYVAKFKNELELIKSKREQWTNVTKPMLKETLKSIKATYDLDWNTYAMEGTTNSEGVNLTFGNSHSGLMERTQKGVRSFVKRGGTLVFSQSYNGDVFIIILYPSVDDLVVPVEPQKLLMKVPPERIDESFVYEQVASF